MLRKISKAFIFALLLISLIPLTFLITAPKFLILDSYLQRAGFFLLNGKVEEGIRHLKIKEVEVYLNSKRVARLNYALLELSPLGLSFKGVCGKGHLLLERSLFGAPSLEFKKFSCAEGVKGIEGSLILEGRVSGKLTLRDISLTDIPVELAELDFKGNKVGISLKAMGTELRGSLKVKWKENNLLGSEVSGRLRGKGLELAVNGTLANLRVSVVRGSI